VSNKIKSKIIFISPKKVRYCIHPSKFCDYTQFELLKIHPHAGINRGVFEQDSFGYVKIINKNWDKKPGIPFIKLLEYRALINHFTGKENWKNSAFAKRNINYIKKNYSERGFTNYKKFLIAREKQIDNLFNSIMKKGVLETKVLSRKKLNNNISVVLTQNSELYFNNRGHHRLSIAKILNIKEIPVQIVVAKSKRKIENFYKKNI